jgi:hypothetical protein
VKVGETTYTLNWHLSLCQNYYDVNVCIEVFFYKSVLSLDSQLADFGNGMRLQFLYLGRTMSSKTPQAKTGRLASSKNPRVFSIFW